MVSEYLDALQGYLDSRESWIRWHVGRANYRTIGLEGVPFQRAHLAVAVTTKPSDFDRQPGRRVQLVMLPPKSDELFGALEARKDRYAQAIPGLYWLERPNRGPRHVEVRSEHTPTFPSPSDEEFEWFRENLARFREVFRPEIRDFLR